MGAAADISSVEVGGAVLQSSTEFRVGRHMTMGNIHTEIKDHVKKRV